MPNQWNLLTVNCNSHNIWILSIPRTCWQLALPLYRVTEDYLYVSVNGQEICLWAWQQGRASHDAAQSSAAPQQASRQVLTAWRVSLVAGVTCSHWRQTGPVNTSINTCTMHLSCKLQTIFNTALQKILIWFRCCINTFNILFAGSTFIYSSTAFMFLHFMFFYLELANGFALHVPLFVCILTHLINIDWLTDWLKCRNSVNKSENYLLLQTSHTVCHKVFHIQYLQIYFYANPSTTSATLKPPELNICYQRILVEEVNLKQSIIK